MSTWLFPFFALVAQLPFETRDLRNNFLSGCLALGSPMLMTYSLALTVMNRRHVLRVFSDLKRRAKMAGTATREWGTRLKLASYVLAEIQHAPVRAHQDDNWLSSLISLEGNSDFWTDVDKALRRTRRGFTYSFFAQGLLARRIPFGPTF